METKVDLIKKVKFEVKKPRNFKVVMYNDDFTTMEFVVTILMDIFNKSYEDAENIMMNIHNKGIGIAGIYSYDMAISKVSKAVALAKEEGFPFKLTVEEA